MNSIKLKFLTTLAILLLSGCASQSNSEQEGDPLVSQFLQQSREFRCQDDACLRYAEALADKPNRTGWLSSVLIEPGLEIGLFEPVKRYVYAGDMAIFMLSSDKQIALQTLNYSDFVPAEYPQRPPVSEFFRCGFDGDSDIADQSVCNAALQLKSVFGLTRLKRYESKKYLLYSGYDVVQEKIFSFIVPKNPERSVVYLYETKGISQEDTISILQW